MTDYNRILAHLADYTPKDEHYQPRATYQERGEMIRTDPDGMWRAYLLRRETFRSQRAANVHTLEMLEEARAAALRADDPTSAREIEFFVVKAWSRFHLFGNLMDWWALRQRRHEEKACSWPYPPGVEALRPVAKPPSADEWIGDVGECVWCRIDRKAQADFLDAPVDDEKQRMFFGGLARSLVDEHGERGADEILKAMGYPTREDR